VRPSKQVREQLLLGNAERVLEVVGHRLAVSASASKGREEAGVPIVDTSLAKSSSDVGDSSSDLPVGNGHERDLSAGEDNDASEPGRILFGSRPTFATPQMRRRHNP
jgi:hypothetical protein